MKRILTQNLMAALLIAIGDLESKGMGESALAEGFREILSAAKTGEQIVVSDE